MHGLADKRFKISGARGGATTAGRRPPGGGGRTLAACAGSGAQAWDCHRRDATGESLGSAQRVADPHSSVQSRHFATEGEGAGGCAPHYQCAGKPSHHQGIRRLGTISGGHGHVNAGSGTGALRQGNQLLSPIFKCRAHASVYTFHSSTLPLFHSPTAASIRSSEPVKRVGDPGPRGAGDSFGLNGAKARRHTSSNRLGLNAVRSCRY